MKKSKSVILVLMSILLIVSLVACSKPGEDKASATMYKAGTYTGLAEGHNGEIKVEVEVDENTILKVRIVEHSESEGISDPAIERIPEDIVVNQSLAVDTISGATVSSNAIIEATKLALI